MKSAEITQRWFNYFGNDDHKIVPSASLVSKDPSVMFTIAGMVPFIPYLTGQSPAPYKRATSVQKCIRTLDIDEVGKTARHGTFFQMAGNFSFGDYFKEGAITKAWKLLTSPQDEGGFGLDANRLWATVYEEDDESYDIWKNKIGLDPARIQKMGKKENFWSTGQPGPAGPDSEIFYDRGSEYGKDGGPAVDDDRYIEIWNLVFMEFERGDGQGKEEFEILGELPQKNIDTGLGLERLAMLLQRVENFYETDQVRPVLDKAAEISGKKYSGSESPNDPGHEDDVRMRVVADHIRSSLMLIADGVVPSNEGRGYILRRLLRRAIRAMRLLGVVNPSLPDLLPASRDAMKEMYPVVEENFQKIAQIAYAEEKAFLRTLSSGTARLEELVEENKKAGSQKISGSQAFELHDTYGFPIDLTLEMADEAGLHVDREAFKEQMTEQRERAQADAREKKLGGIDVKVYQEIAAEGPTQFVGYDELTNSSKIRSLLKEGKKTQSVKEGDEIEIILDQTAFYAEAGGQAADQGIIYTDNAVLEVFDVQQPIKGLSVHKAVVKEGDIGMGDQVTAQVEAGRRKKSDQAHTATHLVHAALHELLGKGASQAGSFNKPGYMRFDFSWTENLSHESQSEIEEVVNTSIYNSFNVKESYMSLEEAEKLDAMMLFGDAYGDTVRVVEIDGAWSRELCGGTHVQNTSQVGALTVLGEQSVGGGNRRIEAYVGQDAIKHAARERALVYQISQLLKAPADQLPDKIGATLEKLKNAEKQLEQLRHQQLVSQAATLEGQKKNIGSVTAVIDSLGPIDSADDLKVLATNVRNRLGSMPSVVVLFGESNNKPLVLALANEHAREKGVKAGHIVRTTASILGGGGGGKDDMAQGGGTDVSKISEAIKATQSYLNEV